MKEFELRHIGPNEESKNEMLKIVNDLKSSFENQKEFDMAKNYINEFFDILINDKYFNQEILSAMRE